MSDKNLRDILGKLVMGERLTTLEASGAMGTIMEGEATAAQIGGVLTALALRGETEDEVVGFAREMRERAIPVRSHDAVDTCGTGGDGAGTFNISTLASLVVAACGVPVAKHGNRAASGKCGSADVLEALGVNVAPGPERVQRCLDEVGWGFLFAPAFHAATRHAVGPRRELGIRTAFNLLGPLTNPARPVAQLVGVPSRELVGFVARCLAQLGIARAWVVHGSGLDEVSPCGPTSVAVLRGGEVREMEITPEDAGLARCELEALSGGDARACAAIARSVLDGEDGAPGVAVVLNAAATLCAAGVAADLEEGAARAREALESGRARELLARVIEVSGS